MTTTRWWEDYWYLLGDGEAGGFAVVVVEETGVCEACERFGARVVPSHLPVGTTRHHGPAKSINTFELCIRRGRWEGRYVLLLNVDDVTFALAVSERPF
jgi:hypothetical protein